jgi:hypothetical protein
VKNKYQSWLDYILGRWKCPNCGKYQVRDPPRIFDDMTLWTFYNGEVQEKSLHCISCHFNEVIWKKTEEIA